MHPWRPYSLFALITSPQERRALMTGEKFSLIIEHVVLNQIFFCCVFPRRIGKAHPTYQFIIMMMSLFHLNTTILITAQTVYLTKKRALFHYKI